MSRTTAITRRTLSRPMKWLSSNNKLNGTVLDYGCGRGYDVEELNIEGYDPNWPPYHEPDPRDRGYDSYDTITCNYVLNVVTEEVGDAILDSIKSLLSTGGTAYITVRRDLPPEGKPGRGCYQRYVVLDYPTEYACASFEIYRIN